MSPVFRYCLILIFTLPLWGLTPYPPLHPQGEPWEEQLTLPNSKVLFYSVAFSPDGKTLASASEDGTIKLWEVSTHKLLTTFTGHSDRVTSVTFSPEGKTLALGSEDGTIKLWEVSTHKLLTTLTGHSDSVTSVAFSPEGKTLAVGSWEGTVSLWDRATHQHVATLSTETISSISSVAFSPEGKTLAVGSVDGTVSLWDRATHRCVMILEGESGPIHAVAFSPEGKTLAAGSQEGKVRLWERSIYRPLRALGGHSGDILSIAFSPDGKTLATGGVGGMMLHPLEGGESQLLYAKGANWGWINRTHHHYYHGAPQLSLPTAIYDAATKTLIVTVVNEGNETIENFTLTLGKDTQTITALPPHATIEKSFVLTQMPKKVTLTLKQDGFVWNRLSLPVTASPMGIYYLILGVLIVVLGGMIYYYRRYKNPLVIDLSTTPAHLFTYRPSQLSMIQKSLEAIHRLQSVLEHNHLTQETFDHALAYTHLTPDGQIAALAQRLNAPIIPHEGYVQWELGEDFPLSLEKLWVLWCPPTALNNLHTILKATHILKGETLLLLGEEATMEKLYAKVCHDTTNLYTTVLPTQLTQLLLSPHPQEILAHILSTQVALTHISPYHVGGGVNRDYLFFGREKIISQILNRGVSNYLIIGSRQVGKSSLLKAIERRYRAMEEVECYYIPASNEHLISDLKYALNHEELSDEAFTRLINGGEKRYLFLIDEADDFVRYEQQHDYTHLKYMRKLSEKNNASFILAGFWEMYRYTYFDYESPIKNFGSQIEVEELEWDACVSLVTQPMKSLGLTYDNSEIIAQMITALGQRANLLQIACEYLITHLATGQKVFTYEDITHALTDKKLLESFQDWNSITKDPKEQWIDRIVVYSTLAQESFDDGFLQNLIRTHTLDIDSNELDKSLARLRIGYIIKKEGNRYAYRVPIFVHHLQQNDIQGRLQHELNKRH